VCHDTLAPARCAGSREAPAWAQIQFGAGLEAQAAQRLEIGVVGAVDWHRHMDMGDGTLHLPRRFEHLLDAVESDTAHQVNLIGDHMGIAYNPPITGPAPTKTFFESTFLSTITPKNGIIISSQVWLP
jgi:hypothetical protein